MRISIAIAVGITFLLGIENAAACSPVPEPSDPVERALFLREQQRMRIDYMTSLSSQMARDADIAFLGRIATVDQRFEKGQTISVRRLQTLRGSAPTIATIRQTARNDYGASCDSGLSPQYAFGHPVVGARLYIFGKAVPRYFAGFRLPSSTMTIIQVIASDALSDSLLSQAFTRTGRNNGTNY